MAIQNPLYGRELSEGEAAAGYQPKNLTLTKLATLTMPGSANYRLALNGEGTDFVWVSPSTDAVPEGNTNQYFTATRVRESITGAISNLTTSNVTASRALVSDTNGKVVTSPITNTELSYLSGTSSNVQAQLATIAGTISALTTTSIIEGNNQYFTTNRAVSAITGAASSIATANLSTARALVSDGSGKVVVSSVTSTELGYIAGLTSGVQSQLNALSGRTITAGSGMTGGGALSSNISLGLSFETSTGNIKMAGTTSVGILNTVPRADHTHPPDTSKISTSLMGVANGVATLDSDTKIPSSQIPTITTTVGFGGEVISVPNTGIIITLPLPINQGGTGTTTASGGLSALGGQPVSPILTTISSNNATGFLVKDASGVAQVRSLQVNNPLTITNPSGNAGNPTISLSQGDGSGLDADLLDGAHGSSYFKVDGSVSYSAGTATSIRGSIGAASTRANTDITSLGSVTGLGNGSTSHINIASTGDTTIGAWPYVGSPAKLTVIGGVAGTNSSTLTVATPNGNNLRACVSLWSTFSNYPADQSIRRTADIIAGFNENIWGTEYLSFNVGSSGTNTLTNERVRIDGNGYMLIGSSTTRPGGGDLQISRGLTFPSTAVACSDVNTLDDYKEGAWTPVIDTATAGTGRATTIYYAYYTKIGNMVTFTAFIALATLGTGGSGGFVVNGLPYTSSSRGTAHWAIAVPYFAGLKAAVMSLGATVQPASTQISFRGYSTAVATVPALDFSTYLQVGCSFILSGFYYV